MLDRAALLTALETITAARRAIMAELDTARAADLASATPAPNEELPQTLSALVRQLDTAAHELSDAIRNGDRRERLKARGGSVG